MLYREAGQFKSTYAQDQQIFPILQDRIGVALMLGFAFLVVPFIGNQYWFSAILTPFLVFSLAALGLNILTGYAGQISLGTGAFMAVGAFMAYKAIKRVPWFSNHSSSGVIAAQKIEILGYAFDTPASKYVLTLAVVAVMALLAKNLVRS